MNKLILLIALFLSVHLIHAQDGTEIGLMGGISLYSGDLSPEEFGVYVDELQPAFGAFMRFNLGKTVALRLGLTLGNISGDDANTNNPGRGLSFRSRITEFSAIGEVNLFKLGRYRDRGTLPYLFGGVAVFRFNPEAEFDGDYIELQPLGTEGQGLPDYDAPYELTQFSIPLGIGVKFLLNESITLGLEFGGRKTFTDYLDDISSRPVNYFDVLEGNGELAAALSNPTLTDPTPDNATYSRGGEFDDWYYFGTVMVSFKLNGTGGGRSGFGRGKGIGCPTF
jgi:hypothetical protein